jgi:dipeptidase E
MTATDRRHACGFFSRPAASRTPSIRDALVELLSKPIASCRALCIPTAQWGHPRCGPRSVREVVAGAPPD